jgi:hypothetical protein
VANSTWLELKTELADGIGGAANPRNLLLAERALGDAISSINGRGVWWFLFHVTSVAGADDTVLTSTDVSYAAPTDMAVHVASALLNEDATRVSANISYVTEEDFFRTWWQTTNVEGRPTVMTRRIETSVLLFNRVPGSDYSGRRVRHAYYKELAVPTSGSTIMSIPRLAFDYIFEEATWRFKRAARVPGGYDRDMQIAMQAEKALLAARPSIDLTSYGFTR